ncbi:MAG: ATP-binding protein [Phaeospirillum sp.]|nr:ATP-binding protein [Phaeospirillum sp.]
MSDSLPPPSSSRKAALALMAAMLALSVWHGFNTRKIADKTAEAMVLALTRTMEYQIDASFHGIDTLLQEAVQRIDAAEWPNPPQLQWLQTRLADFPEARNLLVVGPDGKSAGPGISAIGMIGPSLDVSDRQHFRFHREHPNSNRLIIGDPIVDRLDGRQIIPLSRALVDSTGRFKGMVAVGIDPTFMIKAMESLQIEDAGGISVIRDDGVFLARLPDQYGSFGRSVATSPLFQHFLPRSPFGIARFVSVADGNDKVVGYRTLERYPVVVTVGMTGKTALAPFWNEVIWIGITVFVLSLALYRLAALSDLREHSRAILAARLEKQSQALELQVAERTRNLEMAKSESEHRARQLAASNADLEHFAYVASHDLQEPLRTVTSFVQLLKHRYENSLDAEARDYIGFAVNGAKRMHNLILDLLAYSRVSTQGGAFTTCDLSHAMAEATGDLELAIAETGAVVTVGAMPVLECDQSQMVSLFENLIGNSIKYRQPGVPPVISVETRQEGGEWIFCVRDNGIGIDPQYQDRIFIIFQRLHIPGAFDGTGIGLAICKRIVERHGGRIWMESEPGKGAAFFFTLPSIRFGV